MKHIKHWLATMAVLLCSLTASAEDFEVDGIYYNITSETDLTVEVTYRGTNSNSYPDEYIGEVAIPGTATYNGNTYRVTSVGSSAFYGCKNLTAVTIPEGVTSIGSSAFYGCSSLASITVSETVSTIGSNAFSNCSVLTHIAIPSSVTSVGNFCFSGCIWLDSVVFEDGDETLLLGNCKYSDGVGGGLFEGLRINDVYVGRNLKFSDQNDSYNRPYYTALFACWNANSYPIVSTVTIGPRVTELPDYMFQDCKDLTVITCMAEEVPVCYSSSFKTIRKEKGLDLDRCMLFVPAESVEAYKAAAYWSEFANIRPISTNDVDSGTCGENLTWTLYADGELIIEGMGKMGSYTSSSMPWYCYRTMIKSVTLKEGVTSVGQSAFSGCIRLTSATLPESVTSIGYYAFMDCSSLSSITLPESVTSIGENAFSNGYLTAVHISNLESWCMITFGNYASNPLAYAHDLYLNGELVTELVVPEGVTSIGRMAFYKCSSLTSITIPEGVTSIGNNAFYNCSGVTAITCKAVTPPAIGNSYTFDGVDKSIPVYVPAGSVEAYKAAAYWSEFANFLALPTYVADITLSQSEAMLTEGEAMTLTATATPDDATDKTLTWSSSDERVATVDAAGLVTALAPGTATITVAANDGSGVSASCVVTVKAKATVRCAAPVMDYVDGQVVLTCETEGVEFVTDVVAEGAQRYQTSTFDLAAVYTITAYATKEGYLDSDPVTLTLCWVPCTEEHEDDDTDGIITLPAKPVLIQTAGGVITLTGLPEGTEVAVYDTAGTSLAAATAENGTATLTTNLNTGSTAIVKIGGHSVKVIVK